MINNFGSVFMKITQLLHTKFTNTNPYELSELHNNKKYGIYYISGKAVWSCFTYKGI